MGGSREACLGLKRDFREAESWPSVSRMRLAGASLERTRIPLPGVIASYVPFSGLDIPRGLEETRSARPLGQGGAQRLLGLQLS